MKKTKGSFLWDLLNVSKNASIEEIDEAYKDFRKKGLSDRSKARFAWKILRDPFFSSSYSFYKSKKTMTEAGFFDDKIEPDSIYFQSLSPLWLTTPVIKIQKNLESLKNRKKFKYPVVVMLATGGFSPIHNGHLKMMELAKKELEKKGRIVVGGYISPSHDDYVLHKYQEKLPISSSHYLYLCQKAVEKSNWLMVDSWEAKFNKSPITYTEIMSRLANYLNTHFHNHLPIEVVYVFGSDNAAFAKAFVKKGTCVCVTRPGYEKNMERISNLAELKNNNNIHFVKDKISENISSSAIRSKNNPNFNFPSKDLFERWKRIIMMKNNSKPESYIYCVRDDFEYATKSWVNSKNLDTFRKTRNIFKRKFKRILKDSFRNPNLPDLPLEIFIYFVDLSQQQKWVDELTSKKPVLNLDDCTNSKYKLNISRLFGVSDSQTSAIQSTTRPGYEKLEEGLKNIPNGRYTFVDDDIATKKTTKLLNLILPKKIIITHYISLLNKSLIFSKNLLKDKGKVLDIVDLRDFISGTKDAGLVVVLPNGVKARAPYMLPYVSLVTRAKIPPSRELSVSLNLWKLNAEFYKNIKQTIRLRQTDKAFKNLMRYIGFKDESTMIDICNWHINYLENTTNASV